MLPLIQTARNPFFRMVAAGLDFLAPPDCPACGARLFRAERLERESAAVGQGAVQSAPTSENIDAGGGLPVALANLLHPTLCASCAREMAPPRAEQCRRCAATVGPYLDTRGGCVHCREDRFAFDEAAGVGTYAGRLQWGVLRAKHPEGAPVAAALAGLLCDLRGATLVGWRCDVVAPVPPFWVSRLWQRSHAATVMAEVVAQRLNLRCRTDILAKRRPTAAQSSLPATERRRNLRRAFTVRRRSVAGRRVLLVDDVLTTGTTAHRCARALLEAGAASVHVAVVARGLGKPVTTTAEPRGTPFQTTGHE